MRHNQEEPNKHIVDVLFVLALFGVFAASALMLVTIGANVYKQNVANMNRNFSSRTAYSYITEKLRQNDTSNSISVGQLQDTDALVLSQELDGEEYATYLYYYDGYLKELYIRKDSFSGSDLLDAGQDIMKLSSFSVEEVSPVLLKITLDTEETEPVVIYSALKSDVEQVKEFI